MTLVEPAVAISALEQWLEDAALDYDPEELPGVRAKVAETVVPRSSRWGAGRVFVRADARPVVSHTKGFLR